MKTLKQITLAIIIGTALALIAPLCKTIQTHIADCRAYNRYIEDYNAKIGSYIPYDYNRPVRHITRNPNLSIKG